MFTSKYYASLVNDRVFLCSSCVFIVVFARRNIAQYGAKSSGWALPCFIFEQNFWARRITYRSYALILGIFQIKAGYPCHIELISPSFAGFLTLAFFLLQEAWGI